MNFLYKDIGKTCETTNGSIENGTGYELLLSNLNQIDKISYFKNFSEQLSNFYINEPEVNNRIKKGYSFFKPYLFTNEYAEVLICQVFYHSRYKLENDIAGRDFKIHRIILSPVDPSTIMSIHSPYAFFTLQYQSPPSHFTYHQIHPISLPALSNADIQYFQQLKHPIYKINEDDFDDDLPEFLEMLVELCAELICADKSIQLLDAKNKILNQELFYKLAKLIQQQLPSLELKMLFSCAWNLHEYQDENREADLETLLYILSTSYTEISHPQVVNIVIDQDQFFIKQNIDTNLSRRLIDRNISLGLHYNTKHLSMSHQTYGFKDSQTIPLNRTTSLVGGETVVSQAIKSLYSFPSIKEIYQDRYIITEPLIDALKKVDDSKKIRLSDYWCLLLNTSSIAISNKWEVIDLIYDKLKYSIDFMKCLEIFIEETDDREWRELSSFNDNIKIDHYLDIIKNEKKKKLDILRLRNEEEIARIEKDFKEKEKALKYLKVAENIRITRLPRLAKYQGIDNISDIQKDIEFLHTINTLESGREAISVDLIKKTFQIINLVKDFWGEKIKEWSTRIPPEPLPLDISQNIHQNIHQNTYQNTYQNIGTSQSNESYRDHTNVIDSRQNDFSKSKNNSKNNLYNIDSLEFLAYSRKKKTLDKMILALVLISLILGTVWTYQKITSPENNQKSIIIFIKDLFTPLEK